MIKVLLFAELREKFGVSELACEAAGKTVKDLMVLLGEKYPEVLLNDVMAAVNEEFCGDDMVLHEGDTVALIPPVSGG